MATRLPFVDSPSLSVPAGTRTSSLGRGSMKAMRKE